MTALTPEQRALVESPYGFAKYILGIPVYDSVSTVVWKALQLAGVDTRPLDGWGRLFKELR